MAYQFEVGTVDLRKNLRLNKRRTNFVIGTFILIYAAIGLLVDMFLYAGKYPEADLSQIFTALITLKIFPLATLITIGVALLALLVTFKMSDRIMLMGTEYHQITPETAQSTEELQIYNVVEEMKVAAGLRFMPKVFLIEADYMNAFASGYSEKSAMVAITRGLTEKLDRSELQAVMAHEISHIRHLDIKLTLVASVLSNITLMVIDMLFYNLMFSNGRSDSEGRGRSQLAGIIMLVRFLLPLLTVILMLYLSRTREYMADAGCVELMRQNEPLARALSKIQADSEQNKEAYSYAYNNTANESVRRAAYIFDPVQAGIEAAAAPTDFFSTHPSFEKRLAAIGIKLRKTS
jgi:heat shock protein HtpX